MPPVGGCPASSSVSLMNPSNSFSDESQGCRVIAPIGQLLTWESGWRDPFPEGNSGPCSCRLHRPRPPVPSSRHAWVRNGGIDAVQRLIARMIPIRPLTRGPIEPY